MPTQPTPTPLRPLGLTLLASAVGNQGRVAEMEQLSTDALALATALGPGHEYDRAEARWQLCCAALYAGAPDVQGSIEYLDSALHSGNARALAGGLIHRGCSHPDPELGTESLAEARELTTRTRDSFRYGIATVWLGVLRCTIDPVGALEMIPESSNMRARQVFVCSSPPCVTTRSDSSPSDAMTSCPVLDGATMKPSIRPGPRPRQSRQRGGDRRRRLRAAPTTRRGDAPRGPRPLPRHFRRRAPRASGTRTVRSPTTTSRHTSGGAPSEDDRLDLDNYAAALSTDVSNSPGSSDRTAILHRFLTVR